MKDSLKCQRTWQLFNESTRSHVSPNISTYSGLLCFQNKLSKKYDNCSLVSGMKHIDNVLNDSSSSLTIKFNDCKDFDEEKQYLEETYCGNQINNKFKSIVQCYVFYQDVPRSFISPLSAIIMRRTQKIRMIKYKAFKCSNQVHESSEQKSINQIQKLSKCLPTQILFQQTQDSIQSVINQLSILIQKHNIYMKKNVTVQKCATILKTNHNTSNKLHKLFTLQNMNTKRNMNKSNNKKSSSKKLSVCKQKVVSQQLVSFEKKKTTTNISCKSKRLLSNRKSVQQLIRLRTFSPQVIKQQKLKKKHIRFVTSQHQDRSSFKLNCRHKKISHQKIYEDKISSIKCKPVKKKNIKYQN